MSSFTLFILAVSLAADAFAVAVSTGISQKKISLRDALVMALYFGVFQAIMPIIGYSLASIFSAIITQYDHWIAFFLLGYIGGNMILEGRNTPTQEKSKKNIFTHKSLLVLSIATSIDALAVGVSLTATTGDIYFPALIIGIITAILSFLGIEFGKKGGSNIGSHAEILGGLILIGIGVKILLGHTIFI